MGPNAAASSSPVGIAGHSGYTRRFATYRAERGARIPLTRDSALWAEVVEVGRRTIWIHTYGRRFASHHRDSSSDSTPRLPLAVRPECDGEIGEDAGLPESSSYDATTRILTVGTGSIRNVAPEVWEYRIGGVQVIRKWFSFRRFTPDVERQTPLNDILPPTWTSEWTLDLLELINALGLLVALEPRQARLLDAVSSGPLITTDDLRHEGILPVPTYATKEPRPPRQSRRTPGPDQEALDFPNWPSDSGPEAAGGCSCGHRTARKRPTEPRCYSPRHASCSSAGDALSDPVDLPVCTGH